MKPMSEFSIDELKNLMKNAERLGRKDVWSEACRHLAHAQGRPYADGLERAVFEAISAYESVLSFNNGKTTRAGYIRPMIDKVGVVKALETIVKKRETSAAHDFLVVNGLTEYTFAYIVTEFSEKFTSEAVENALHVLSEA